MSYHPSYGIWRHAPVFLQVTHPGRARCKHCGDRILQGHTRLGWHGRYYHISCWWTEGRGHEFTDMLLHSVLTDGQLAELGIRIEAGPEPTPTGPIPLTRKNMVPGAMIRLINPPQRHRPRIIVNSVHRIESVTTEEFRLEGIDYGFTMVRLTDGSIEIVSLPQPVRPAQTCANMVPGARVRFTMDINDADFNICAGDEHTISRTEGSSTFYIVGNSYAFTMGRLTQPAGGSVEILEVPR